MRSEMNPIVSDIWRRNPAASVFRRYPSSVAASTTRCRVASGMALCLPLRTSDTVDAETPARSATSFMLTLPDRGSIASSGSSWFGSSRSSLSP
jgi:hypothetical protein